MRTLFTYLDKITLIIMLAITSYGIILIYSASYNDKNSYWLKQIIWLTISLLFFFITFLIKSETIFKSSKMIYTSICIVMAIQLIAGKISSGTKSWLFAGGSVQISEFAKIAIALVTAKTISHMEEINWKNAFYLLLVISPGFILIAMQPDLGTASVISVPIVLCIALLKKIKRSIIIFSLLSMIITIFVSWNFILLPYQKNRILSFLNPQKYKKSSGYQVIQSRIAIGSGGLQGKGFLKGSQTQYKFLPARHTDFILSIMGEEFGFIGISIFFGLFLMLFYRQYNFKCENKEQFYYVYLFNTIILYQFLVNTLMTIGFVPILGIPLPFVSYGGSSLLALFIGEALIFKIKVNSFIKNF